MDVIAGGYFTGEIAMNGIASGVYIVSLSTEKDKVQGKVLKFQLCYKLTRTRNANEHEMRKFEIEIKSICKEIYHKKS